MSAVNTSECNNLKKGLDIANYSVSSIEPIDKISKIIYRSIDFVSNLTGKVSIAFTMLSFRLKDTADIIEGIALPGRVKEIACPDENGKYFFRKSSWQKCADRVFLVAASVFKTVYIGVKLSLLNLGKIAKVVIGKGVPLLRLIPDSLIAISSFFNCWENKNVLKEANANHKLATEKVERWSNRSTLIEQVRKGNYWEMVELEKNYKAKVEQLKTEIRESDAATDGPAIAQKSALIKKYEERMKKIKLHDNVGLANDLAKSDINFKVQKWSVEQSNAQITKTKAWLGIANSVGKIYVITFATTIFGLGLTTTPFMLALLGTGIVVDSIGLTKILHDYAVKKQPSLKEPVRVG